MSNVDKSSAVPFQQALKGDDDPNDVQQHLDHVDLEILQIQMLFVKIHKAH